MEYVIGVAATFVSIGVSWGIISTKVKQIEEQMDDMKKDHDLIIRLDTKMDGINENIRELRSLIENKRAKR